MKKKLLFIVTMSILYSCSNESFEDSLNLDTKKQTSLSKNNDSVYVLNSFEDWNKLIVNEYSNDKKTKALSPDFWYGLPKGYVPYNTTKSFYSDGVDFQTTKGYSNIRKSATSRTMFTENLAKFLGLQTGRIYHVHTKYVDKSVSLPANYTFFENDSPNCGYAPFREYFTFENRGYKMSVSGSNVIMTSFIYFVECDEWAAKINKSYPCDASQLEWNYILWGF